MRYAAFCIARFLARSSSSDLLLSHSGLPASLSACPQTSRQLPTPLAYRELHEWRGEAVRKPDHKYCHIAVRLCFCTRHVLAPISGESFSVGLRLAKITEARAKWYPCPQASCYCVQACPQVSRLLHSATLTSVSFSGRGCFFLQRGKNDNSQLIHAAYGQGEADL